MAHNIETYADIRGEAFSLSNSDSTVQNNSVLTVEDNAGCRARLLFKRHDSGVTGPALVLNPWPNDAKSKGVDMGPNLVTIEGEDLYALRALLEELPAEAFVEPAPSVKEPEWVEGDRVIASNNSGRNAWLYVRGEDWWEPGVAITPSASDGVMPMTDGALDRYIATGGHSTDGDVFTVIIKNGKKVKA